VVSIVAQMFWFGKWGLESGGGCRCWPTPGWRVAGAGVVWAAGVAGLVIPLCLLAPIMVKSMHRCKCEALRGFTQPSAASHY